MCAESGDSTIVIKTFHLHNIARWSSMSVSVSVSPSTVENIAFDPDSDPAPESVSRMIRNIIPTSGTTVVADTCAGGH
jgi:hypothetical protein